MRTVSARGRNRGGGFQGKGTRRKKGAWEGRACHGSGANRGTAANGPADLSDFSPALIWQSDASANLVHFNRTWLEFTGRTLAEESGAGWTEAIHPDDKEIFRREFQAPLDRRVPLEAVFRMRRNDGVYRWIEHQGRPSWDRHGGFTGYIGYSFDRTEQHETEEILHKLSRAVEQGTSSIVITDVQGCIEYVNSSFSTLTGFDLSELIGHNPRIERGKGGPPELFGAAWEALQRGEEWRGELLSSKKGGKSYWEYATFSPILNADDVVTHFLIVKEDITARKTAERELVKSKAQLQVKHAELQHVYAQVARSQKEWESTMDCIGDMVILVDTHGVIRRSNKALKEFIGPCSTKIDGAPLKELLSRHGLDLPDDLSFGKEVTHQASGRCFICRSYPFAVAGGEIRSGMVLTLHDFTERNRVSCELQKACSVLKATQAQVIQQEKMASIGQLAAGVAHEINNPMGFISSNLGTLRSYLQRLTEFVEAQAEVVGTLANEESIRTLAERRRALKIDYVLKDGKELIMESLDGAERVRNIVQNLNGFARLDAPEQEPADLNECLESSIRVVWNQLKFKVQLVREFGAIPPVRCHPQQLNQVFLNLVVNAGQAIETEGIIVVKSWHDEESIYVSVADNGCGIPADKLGRIFDPFFTTKEVGKGTGLGLSVSYDIVKNHQGEITVESAPGKGTCFIVRLPIC
jgi:two-component system, NtrC family, sensor kinase